MDNGLAKNDKQPGSTQEETPLLVKRSSDEQNLAKEGPASMAINLEDDEPRMPEDKRVHVFSED